MDLNSLRLFVTAVRAGSFSEAARRTGIPLPTLSRKVRQLEDDLGVRLLERGARGLSPTTAGSGLLGDVEPALAALAQAEQRLHDLAGIAGTLRVSIPPDFEPIWAVFSRFGRRHPAVRFDVFVTDRRVDLVADGIDVAIHVAREGDPTETGRRLIRYRHRVVASPAFLERHGVREPGDVGAVPCACWRTRTAAPPVWQLGAERVPLDPRLATNDYLQLLRMALSGEVLTELPPFLASPAIDQGRLFPVLEDHPLPAREVRAVVADARWLPPLVRRFLDFAGDALREELGEP